MWRYQDIVATPIPGQYQAQPCARLSPERQRQSYQASHEDMSMSRPSTGKYGYVSTPITNYNMRDKFRWPYPSQSSRGTRQSCTEVRTNPEKRKFCHLFDSSIQEKVSSIQETSFVCYDKILSVTDENSLLTITRTYAGNFSIQTEPMSFK